jgi:hypothetical protein
MSMRSEFDKILKQHGHNIYLQRSIVDEDSEITYSDALEKHTSRFSIGIHRALPRAKEEALEGILNTTDRSYYLKYDVNPFENDRIYDYSPRAPGQTEVWKIDAVVGLRGDNGRVIYWVLGATREIPS